METTEDKTPALFLKLNSQNAFDIVYWSHLIENVAGPGFQTMLVHLDFHHLQHGKVKRNTEWSTMWPSHLGVHKGTHFCPCFFILAIGPLQKILDLNQ